jgi:UDP-glucose 4-epimerase
MKVLLTGGAGFIGSHAALAVLGAGHEPILLDDFSNSRPDVVDRLADLAGRPLTCVRGNTADRDVLHALFSAHEIGAVMHFAARKSVAESVADPLSYHSNNVGGLIGLLEAMDRAGMRSIVFSSSATVYGEPDSLPITEDHPTRAVNPYGQTKLISENMLSDLARAKRGWRVSLLRYFNPVGAHPSGLIGEDPRGTPTNLMPLITRVALGQDAHLRVFGRDYPTEDGTAVRD